MSLATAERRKYEKVWQIPQYADYSPGEWALPIFRQLVRRRGRLLDIGCGTGRAAMALTEAGFKATGTDFVDARQDQSLPFVKQNLWTRWSDRLTERPWAYGYCCDVMEHIPPEKVEAVLANIFEHCERVFFLINFTQDGFGRAIGHPLHLTIQPFVWWRDLLASYRTLKDARDLIGMGTFYCVP